MNEDTFNIQIRKFLKKVGITSQREIEKAVRDAVESGKLKGNEKLEAVVVLKDIYGWSHAEVAKALDISVTAAKVRLHRARQKLKEKLWREVE